MGARRALRPRWFLALALLVGVLNAGCSGVVPLAPAPSFVPDGPPSPQPMTRARPADVQLAGALDTSSGLTATVRTEFWFGDFTEAPLYTEQHPTGWVTVHLPVSGALTVTNTSAVANPAATSVYYTIHAAYPIRSTVCRHAPPNGGEQTTPGLCWRTLATVTPFSYSDDEPDQLPPGQLGTDTFGASTSETGLWVDVPGSERGDVTAELARPANVVVLTHPISVLRTATRFARACGGEVVSPSSASQSGSTSPYQWVPVGALRPGSCASWPGF